TSSGRPFRSAPAPRWPWWPPCWPRGGCAGEIDGLNARRHARSLSCPSASSSPPLSPPSRITARRAAFGPEPFPLRMASPLRRLNPYLWRYRRLMIPGLLCALASAVLALIVPGVVREAVDAIPRMVALHGLYAGTPVEGELYRHFAWTLVLAGALILALSLASGVFSFRMRQTVVVASRHIEYDLRNRLYAHLQRLSGAFYKRYPTGDVLTRASSDIERVRRYIGPAYMYTARAVTSVGVALVVMILISPTLTLWALLPMPALAVAIFFVSKMVHVRTD